MPENAATDQVADTRNYDRHRHVRDVLVECEQCGAIGTATFDRGRFTGTTLALADDLPTRIHRALERQRQAEDRGDTAEAVRHLKAVRKLSDEKAGPLRHACGGALGAAVPTDNQRARRTA